MKTTISPYKQWTVCKQTSLVFSDHALVQDNAVICIIIEFNNFAVPLYSRLIFALEKWVFHSKCQKKSVYNVYTDNNFWVGKNQSQSWPITIITFF